ncbi:NAD kinase 2, chloroplastic-like isoform X1 [Juglans microcarpa x Juglans regia]|uniref:NAD kinase 2, chloroplastic-like isoform X1 n=1 Tax=Juglans microcarpa x Juglans regia TaxID=2249226 RepID=UPI001B7EABAA|nr:NAD kinase 2, chloroplastic-like isoform X1 [Juglans microcarpa x Juglans regia]
MNHSSPATGISSRSSSLGSHFCPSKTSQFSVGSLKLCGFGFELKRKDLLKRRLKFVVSAELSKPFSLSFGLDSQTFRSHDPSQAPWIGPVPGDIAEVEAYCRIFRTTEWLHAALMDTLCNPLTGECSISYDFTPEEKPLLEDKIVSVLGCMVSLLNKGREDVLSGRSPIQNSFRVGDVSSVEDKLPPLAIFRSEMKRCCESLHIALENYLMPDDDRSLDVWRKLQRLKNVCYDSGFPRGENYPCHTQFANWNPIYFSTSKEDIWSKDSEVAFWMGGQVTEEGLKWLVKKGYKTIVDLRAETVTDNFYQAALDDAVLSGKIELVKIPVEVGTAPSMEQVEKFASLVSDYSKKPIYLHSKEGVKRTLAMVSRWRQYMSRCSQQFVSGQHVASNGFLLQDADGMRKMQESCIVEESSLLGKESGLMQESLGSNGVPYEKVSPYKGKKHQSSNGALSSLVSVQGMPSELADNGVGSPANFTIDIDPLKVQAPTCNVFSKKEMSRFFRSRKISPSTYKNDQLKGFQILPISRDAHNGTMWKGDIVRTDTMSQPLESGGPNGSLNGKTLSPETQKSPADDEKNLIGDILVSVGPVVNGLDQVDRPFVMTETNISTVVNTNFDETVRSQSILKDRKSNSGAALISANDDLGPIEGNMCASTTGVVRVQSRKKAEMFLVRTDGHSCAREKVTESSLAFTHPSTQQQMLMWKSTPKTVLLLKKLGQELMEEAKEVATFLYYQEKMNVLVEPDVHDIFARIPGFGFVQTFYSQDTSDLHERVDFVACLGGDGVILHASNLFRGAVPPVVSFNLGSLGFLTSHGFEDYKQDLRQVIHGNNTLDGVYITLRMRLRCEIFRNGKAVPGKVFDVLNEVVVDRGSNPYLSKIECYEHDRLITKVQGDGVIVATPTGSTAYSTAAGGSMVHPNVPCMLFTPICPHSLSFRPVILPDSARLELKIWGFNLGAALSDAHIPEDARSNAWVSFDGKRRQQLSRGDSVRIHMSQHPLPTVNKSDQTCDWFHSLIRCLNWNERLDQKAL